MNTGKHESRSKQRGQDGDRKIHHLLFFTHILCMNYVIAMFLLASCINTRNLLLYLPGFVYGQPPIARTKTYNKELFRVS